MLAVIGTAVAVVGTRLAVGRPGRRAVRLRLAPRGRLPAARRARSPAEPPRRSGRCLAVPARPLLPGAAGFYAALALLAGAGGGARAGRGTGGAGLRSGAGARWASTGELRRLRRGPARGPRRPTRARPPGRPAPLRRAPPRAGRLRTAAVGQVGRPRDPGAARLERPRGRLLDQDRSARRHDRPAPSARPGARVRSVRAGPDALAHLVAAARRGDLGRRARGRVAAGLGGRGRPPRRRGRRLLGGRGRAAAGPAAVSPRRPAAPAWTAWSAGSTARGRGSSTRRSADQRRGRRTTPARPTRAPPTTRCGRSRPRPIGRARRSRRPPRPCCAPTASSA